MYTSNGTEAQKFVPMHQPDGSVVLKCMANDKVVDVCGARPQDGTEIWLYSNNDTKAQK